MGKIRQKLAHVAQIEIRARIEIFEISRDEELFGRHAPGFGRHMENVGKKVNFFSCQNKLPKVPRIYFLVFFDKSNPHSHLPPNLAEIRQKRPLEAAFKSSISVFVTG